MALLTLRREPPSAWLMTETATGIDVGGIRYEHAADGNHYRTWLLVDGVPTDFGEPVPQLAMAARAIETEMVRRKR